MRKKTVRKRADVEIPYPLFDDQSKRSPLLHKKGGKWKPLHENVGMEAIDRLPNDGEE